MIIYRFEILKRMPGDTALCLGTFDGVHLGHQTLLAHTVACARARGLLSCVFTFDVPPAYAMNPCDRSRPLMTVQEKAERMGELGIDAVVSGAFAPPLSLMSADEFVQRVVLNQLRARHVVVGFHYRYGLNAEGNAESLYRCCARANISCDILSPVRDAQGRVISSTGIRAMLQSGDAAGAAEWLHHMPPDERLDIGEEEHRA